MWKIIFPVALAFLFSSCAFMPRSPLMGGLYTGVMSGQAVSAQAGPKEGHACAIGILGAIAVGDASVDTARKNGGITSISIVDEKSTSILFGLYQQHCTIVHGK